MSLWFRVGPLSLSSRGRVGARLGPVKVYGGGRSRRGSNDELVGLVAVVFVVSLLIAAVVAFWKVILIVAAIAVGLGAAGLAGVAWVAKRSEPATTAPSPLELQQRESLSSSGSFACPGCGEPITGGTVRCNRCGHMFT